MYAGRIITGLGVWEVSFAVQAAPWKVEPLLNEVVEIRAVSILEKLAQASP